MEALNFDSRKYCKGNLKPCIIGVFGSRSLSDERVDIELLNVFKEVKPTKIVTTQEPTGVCEVAQKVCKEYAYPLQLHFLNKQYLQGAFEQRSLEVIKEADYFIVIHDGVSRGTLNELTLIKKAKKPYRYIKMEPQKTDNKSEKSIYIGGREMKIKGT